jgi:hypothetical protein
MLLFSDNVTWIVKLYLCDSLGLFTTVSLIGDILRLRLGRLRRLVWCQILGKVLGTRSESGYLAACCLSGLPGWSAERDLGACSCLSRLARATSSRAGQRLPGCAW